MKQRVEGFGTAERTQELYERVINKLDRIETRVTTSAYFIAFFCGFCVVGLIFQVL